MYITGALALETTGGGKMARLFTTPTTIIALLSRVAEVSLAMLLCTAAAGGKPTIGINMYFLRTAGGVREPLLALDAALDWRTV